ncbi:endonuclease/exonuclease/phosphatase family protein [Oceanisphaera pacifica]|uniref:Endonuclease/exonuclease/phosphatase family protein n=1 Tax=Oceanisphaera pacifica TaxID=2818389 RepID=A0ABS3NG32_9GAMM|nr:endonuclease/exonuclease/phosphatase family protein [Oceanisphaera pacifica]MBO1519531.1 endonuclease/exonuclease/phosphatase family protein [Oceanisphaera pacifica]
MELTLFILATLLSTVITLLPLWRCEAWWVRGLDFPRVQFFYLILTIIVLALWRLDLWAASSLGILTLNTAYLLYHGWWILPYTRFHPAEVAATATEDAPSTITILSSNVLATNRHADCLIELVERHQPDILVTLESTHWWEQQLAVLEADYPYTIKCPLDNLYGMHVYSRLVLKNSRIEYLVQDDVPSMHCLVELACGSQIITHFIHPAPPSPTENEESSERDAELLAVADKVADTQLPVIVAGDLNDVAWSPTTRLFRKISGLLDPRIGRGMFNTFHAEHWFIRWPLDHLFHSHHFRVSQLQRLTLKGSDHFALLSRLSFKPNKRNGYSELSADADDQQWAKEKMHQENVNKSDVPDLTE